MSKLSRLAHNSSLEELRRIFDQEEVTLRILVKVAKEALDADRALRAKDGEVTIYPDHGTRLAAAKFLVELSQTSLLLKDAAKKELGRLSSGKSIGELILEQESGESEAPPSA